MTSAPSPASSGDGGYMLPISFVEFVALIALLMALTAMSIDIMLPSLPQIAGNFAVADPNETQEVVTAYLAGFAVGQLLWGPLSDRYGRKPLLMTGLAAFLLATLGAIYARSFDLLLLARAAQGFGASAPRALSLAIVRDQFAGRAMARVMSFAMMVFILVPVFAPSIGQALAHTGSWRTTFYFLLAAGTVAIAWTLLRLPETLGAAARERIAGASYIADIGRVLASRATMGYAIAGGFMFGCLMGYVASAQQVFVDVYRLGDHFPIAFGAVASVMALASLVNARFVTRLGMRPISHTALAAYVAVSGILALLSVRGEPPLILFCILVAACFFLFGLIVANFNAMAMEPLQDVAGTGSSLVGFYTTAAGAVLGWFIGAHFDGSVAPLATGFFLCSLAAFLTVVATEGPRHMFRATRV